LTDAQRQLMRDYVSGGGRLIAMRPDPALADLFGLGTYLGAKPEALLEYYGVDTSTDIGRGIEGASMQYHGVADRYTGASGTVVASLYTNATTASAEPAIVQNQVGAGGAVAFTFDLSRSVALLRQGPVLIYSTAAAESVKLVQEQLGAERAGAMLERTLAAIAKGLVQLGVRQLVVAGGETSGACVQALNVTQMTIGPQIDPGVPWCHAFTDSIPAVGLHLALKSGNFGDDDFFIKAFSLLA
jgi:hypothetical protein